MTFGSGQSAVTTDDISDVTISRSISGMGLSGICITQLSFTTVYDMSLVGIAELTAISGLGALPDFWIDRRYKRNGVWTVECCDRAAFLDTPIDGITKTGGKYQVSAITDRMKVVCGLYSVQLPVSFPAQVEARTIDGKTYQSFLQEISEAYTGFFYIASDTTLNFFSPPNGTYLADCAPSAYTRPVIGADFSYHSVRAENGAVSTTVGSGLPVLVISNDFTMADSAHSGYYAAVNNFSLTEMSAEIVQSTVLMPFSRVVLSNTAYIITSVTARVVGAEIWQSVAASLPQTGEISRKGLLQRRLDDMVSTTKQYGTGKMTASQGYIVTDEGA